MSASLHRDAANSAGKARHEAKIRLRVCEASAAAAAAQLSRALTNGGKQADRAAAVAACREAVARTSAEVAAASAAAERAAEVLDAVGQTQQGGSAPTTAAAAPPSAPTTEVAEDDEEEDPGSMLRCSGCSAEKTRRAQLLKCSACKREVYCGRDCAARHWRGDESAGLEAHKASCAKDGGAAWFALRREGRDWLLASGYGGGGADQGNGTHGVRVGMLSKAQRETALTRASASGALPALRLLARACTDVQHCGSSGGGTPLTFASAVGRLESVRLLVALKADVDFTGGAARLGRTALFDAASKGACETIAALCKLGAQPNRFREAGSLLATPLHAAVLGGHTSAVEMLVTKYGADMYLACKRASGDEAQWWDCRAIHLAAGKDNVEMIETLHRLGAAVDSEREGKHEYTEDSVSIAIRMDSKDAVRCLVRLKATLDFSEDFGASLPCVPALDDALLTVPSPPEWRAGARMHRAGQGGI